MSINRADQTAKMSINVEPSKSRYIYVDRKTNRVFLTMPFLSGSTIGTDNTCQSAYQLTAFFGKNKEVIGALAELKAYKAALECDCFLENTEKRQARLQQVEEYIHTLEQLNALDNKEIEQLHNAFPSYPSFIASILQKRPSNLYSMLLRPVDVDTHVRAVDPVFSLNRPEYRNGVLENENPSVFDMAIQNIHARISFDPNRGQRGKFRAAVLADPRIDPFNFETLQIIMSEKTRKLFGQEWSFLVSSDRTELTKEYMQTVGMLNDEDPVVDYIDSILDACEGAILFDGVSEEPFDSIMNAGHLSILVQFFLAEVNIHCFRKGLSSADFGKILDDSEALCNQIAEVIKYAEEHKLDISNALLDVISEQFELFEMTEALSPRDRETIQKNYIDHYMTIKRTPHMDEFSVMDSDEPGPCKVYQNAFCVNFAEVMQAFPEFDTEYYSQMRGAWQDIDGKLFMTNDQLDPFEVSETEFLAMLTKWVDNRNFDIVCKIISHNRSGILRSEQVNDFLAFITEPRYNGDTLLIWALQSEPDVVKNLLSIIVDLSSEQYANVFLNREPNPLLIALRCCPMNIAHILNMIKQRPIEEQRAQFQQISMPDLLSIIELASSLQKIDIFLALPDEHRLLVFSRLSPVSQLGLLGHVTMTVSDAQILEPLTMNTKMNQMMLGFLSTMTFNNLSSILRLLHNDQEKNIFLMKLSDTEILQDILSSSLISLTSVSDKVSFFRTLEQMGILNDISVQCMSDVFKYFTHEETISCFEALPLNLQKRLFLFDTYLQGPVLPMVMAHIEFLQELSLESLIDKIQHLSYVDGSNLIDRLPARRALAVFCALDSFKQGKILLELPMEKQFDFFQRLSKTVQMDMFSELSEEELNVLSNIWSDRHEGLASLISMAQEQASPGKPKYVEKVSPDSSNTTRKLREALNEEKGFSHHQSTIDRLTMGGREKS